MSRRARGASDETDGARLVRGDLASGLGLRETVEGAEVIVHSIVGVDAVPLSYYHAKRAAEEEVVRSGLAWTIGRSTQFHDLVLSILRFLHRGPLLAVPRGFASSRSTSPRSRSASPERSKPAGSLAPCARVDSCARAVRPDPSASRTSSVAAATAERAGALLAHGVRMSAAGNRART